MFSGLMGVFLCCLHSTRARQTWRRTSLTRPTEKGLCDFNLPFIWESREIRASFVSVFG